jgi:hypothetical protein
MVTVLPVRVSVYGVVTGVAVSEVAVIAVVAAVLLGTTTTLGVVSTPLVGDSVTGEIAPPMRARTSGTPMSATNHQPPGRRR